MSHQTTVEFQHITYTREGEILGFLIYPTMFNERMQKLKLGN